MGPTRWRPPPSCWLRCARTVCCDRIRTRCHRRSKRRPTLNVDSWIFVADDEPIGGLLNLARELGGGGTLAVGGPRARADAVAAAGPDRVLWHPTTVSTPPEAFAGQVAAQVKQAAPGVL